MHIDTIEGKWVGTLKFDDGYPLELQIKYIPFVMEIYQQGGMIKGTCIDDHTKHLNIEPASIVGTFENKTIKFIKTHPHLLTLDENLKAIIVPDKPPVGVPYFGRLHKKLFSPDHYFKGKCSSTVVYTNKMGFEKKHIFSSLWSMKRIT